MPSRKRLRRAKSEEATASTVGRKRRASSDREGPEAKRPRPAAYNEASRRERDAADATALLVWGCGEMGQLGLGPDVIQRARPTRVKHPLQFTLIGAFGMHTVAVSGQTIVTFGCNDEGALGRATDEEEECFVPSAVTIPASPGTSPSFRVVQVCGGDSHSAVLTADGRVFAWGTFRGIEGRIGLVERGVIERAPRLLTLPKTGVDALDQDGSVVTQIASGNCHLVLLTRAGVVYTGGAYDGGQLGRFPDSACGDKSDAVVDSAIKLSPVKLGRNLGKFDAAFAGCFGTFFREAGTGRLFACGSNMDLQLGVTPTKPEGDPTRFREPFPVACDRINNCLNLRHPGSVCAKVVGGRDHSLFLTDDGKAYSAGRLAFVGAGKGDGVPLAGDGDFLRVRQPFFLNPAFPGSAKNGTVVDVAANETISFAIVQETQAQASDDSRASNGEIGKIGDAEHSVERKRHLLSWGFQTNMQLGRATPDDCDRPVAVELAPLVPLKISAGGMHATLLAKDPRPM